MRAAIAFVALLIVVAVLGFVVVPPVVKGKLEAYASEWVRLGAAQEAALKLKETCGLHAEAFSAAEVRHGPMALVGPEFPVLVFAQQDGSFTGTVELADEFRNRGAHVWLAAEGTAWPDALPVVPVAHPACAPLATVLSFYRAANALSQARGYDPDRPPHLNKVTRTL